MAKILYAVHGTGHGHAMRALTIARHFREHEFRFISHGAGAAILRPQFSVVEAMSLITVVNQHRVAPFPTLLANLRILAQGPRLGMQLERLVRQYRPDAILCDYEFFLPLVCRRLGLPCLNLDHQHVITFCHHEVPPEQQRNYVGTALIVRLLYSFASHFIVTSFFQPPLKPGLTRVHLAPPLLRASVLERRPENGDHVVAYQGYSTFQRFFPFLQAIPRPVMVYGFDREERQGNLWFKKNSESGFLNDLASCRYVVCGGSHSLLSETLYYGKPVFSFPIQDAFEQYLNAFYLERLGLGACCTKFQPSPALVPAFEAKVEQFQRNMQHHSFCGNQEIFTAVARFITSP